MWTVLGSILMLILSKINVNFFKEHHQKLFWLAFFLLILTIIPNKISYFPNEINIFAPELNGAQRWLYINPYPLPSIPFIGRLSFQTSEFVKLLVIIVFARFFANAVENKMTGLEVNKRFLASSALIVVPIMIQPNLSTSLIVFAILSGIYLLSGVPKLIYLLQIPLLCLILTIIIFSSEYRSKRIMTLLNDGNENSYHINQISIALGSGGLVGKGIGSSVQKYSYVPEVNTDSIFAIIGEEFGLLGTSTILIIYYLLISTCINIAIQTTDLYKKYIVFGVAIWIFVQSSINLMAITKLIPLTGIPLPLLSYGGSSTIFLMMAFGIILNISNDNYAVKK